MLKLLYIIVYCCTFYFTEHICSMPITPETQKEYYARSKPKKLFATPYINFQNPELYIFTFNVGQGNFCLIRRNNKIVIVDAGKGDNLEDYINIANIDEGFLDPFFENAIVEAVFLTHPHEDHFNLFSDGLIKEALGPRGGKHPTKTSLLDRYQDSLQETKFWLGGTEKDWQRTQSQRNVIEKLKGHEMQYMGRGHEDNAVYLLEDVIFYMPKISPFLPKDKCKEENKLSLILQVFFNNKSILFLGDAEGESIDRLEGISIDLHELASINQNTEAKKMVDSIYKKIDKLKKFRIDSFMGKTDLNLLTNTSNIDNINKEYWGLFDELKGPTYCPIKSILSKYKDQFNNFNKGEDEIDQLEKELKNCSLENFQESLQKKSFFLDYIHSSLITDLFGQAQLIFLPHHGTNTENSQRYLGSLKNESKERTFVVNSSPFGPQHLPKKSTWELAPKVPVHPEHPFSFGHDNSETVSMKLTTKPIYVTGIAPCGMYCFRISDKFENDGIYMLNLFNEPYSWFNIVPKCSSIRNSH